MSGKCEECSAPLEMHGGEYECPVCSIDAGDLVRSILAEEVTDQDRFPNYDGYHAHALARRVVVLEKALYQIRQHLESDTGTIASMVQTLVTIRREVAAMLNEEAE